MKTKPNNSNNWKEKYEEFENALIFMKLPRKTKDFLFQLIGLVYLIGMCFLLNSL